MGYFNPAGRTWAGGHSTIPGGLIRLESDHNEQLGSGEQETWKDKNYAKEAEPHPNKQGAEQIYSPSREVAYPMETKEKD